MQSIHKKQIRPNTSVDFFSVTDEDFKTWMMTNWVDSGKMLRPEVSVSADGLEQTTSVMFRSESECQEWASDPYVVEKVHAAQEAYCAAHGITLYPSRT